jgi:hypothetical protein
MIINKDKWDEACLVALGTTEDDGLGHSMMYVRVAYDTYLKKGEALYIDTAFTAVVAPVGSVVINGIVANTVDTYALSSGYMYGWVYVAPSWGVLANLRSITTTTYAIDDTLALTNLKANGNAATYGEAGLLVPEVTGIHDNFTGTGSVAWVATTGVATGSGSSVLSTELMPGDIILQGTTYAMVMVASGASAAVVVSATDSAAAAGFTVYRRNSGVTRILGKGTVQANETARTGTGTCTISSGTVTGTSTLFAKELRVGDMFVCGGTTHAITAVTSTLQITVVPTSSLTTATAFTYYSRAVPVILS